MSLVYDGEARTPAQQVVRLLQILAEDQRLSKIDRKRVCRCGRSTKAEDEAIFTRREIIRQIHVLRGDKEYWGQKTWRNT